MSQLREYCHVVPRHPPFRNLPILYTEHCSKIKSHSLPRWWEWPHLSHLGALVCCPDSHKIPFGHEMRDSLKRVRKDCGVLPAEILELLTAADVEIWSRLTMASNVRSEDFVEKVQLLRVHGLPETPDYVLILLVIRLYCHFLTFLSHEQSNWPHVST